MNEIDCRNTSKFLDKKIIIYCGYKTKPHFARFNLISDKLPARSIAPLTHRLVQFQLTDLSRIIMFCFYKPHRTPFSEARGDIQLSSRMINIAYG